ncbi:HlyD family secretion protein [Acinetobacter sp. FNA3]|jgi:multidrug resistance efflux pump|nr:HlyD family secretion protein [Acinetobacter pollinis]MBF7692452.1 HlyD family secretion protein [Acinetobacter pollinis]MBF7697277.1 HlyD family secretion protein [Acinetobacter pollinis]MBF7701154.1 HlyD family secretion protein [Acinetobacter pollinis]
MSNTNDTESKNTKKMDDANIQIKSIPRVGKLIKTKKSTLILMFFVLLIGIAAILWAWRLGPFNSPIQQTDNSYIKGKTTVLSSQINGYIQEVLVNDFDHVKKGQPLIKINPDRYDQQVIQAQATVDQAKNSSRNQNQTIEQRKADILAAKAKIAQADAQYQLSLQQLRRYRELQNTGAISKTEFDSTNASVKNNLALLQQAQANLDVSNEALKTAQVAQIGLDAQIKNSQAALDQAQITKNYAIITAPMDGQLGEVTPRLGQYVAAGTQLLFLIPPKRWIIANFKETQMDGIKIGQKASFTVDALNHQKFTGHVEQISPAAGSEFSVLKADNATGNFTKVVQRIPVRISIDDNQQDLSRLSPGMSVETSVDTNSAK